MEMLPNELVSIILCRVPLTSFSKIKCVCKQWRAIISDPQFSKLHHQTNNGVYNTEILAFTFTPRGLKPSSLDFENKDTVEDLSDIFFPRNSKYVTRFLCSCNGLVCLQIGKMVVIWNPCTNQYRTLPQPSSGAIQYSCSFGYDPIHDDYKFFWIHSWYHHLKIYSLKSSTWSSCDLSSFNLGYRGIYLNGSLHYLNHGRKELIAFSLAEEKLGDRVSIPDAAFPAHGVAVLDDCICIWRDYHQCDAIGFWVMKEYMVKDSWSKLCSILKNQIPHYVYRIKPLCTSKDGHILLEIEEATLVKYNMKQNNICTITDKFYKLMPYVPTLVSPYYNESFGFF